jgi:hypothetical protein
MHTQTKYRGCDVFASYCLKGQAHTIRAVHTPPVHIAGSVLKTRNIPAVQHFVELLFV